MKKIYWIILVTVALCVMGVFWYYKTNYIDTITEYYKLTYTPPMEKDVSWGLNDTTEPKFKLERIANYKNDSIAVVVETKREKADQKFYYQELKKCIATKSRKDITGQLEKTIEIEVYKELINSQVTIFCFTHRQGYDSKNILVYTKSYKGDILQLKRFCDKNKIEFRNYPIND
ncbi:MAG: hypothetical protein LKF48_10755 [Prevotella sp.]|jgi:ABC-type antimicrobial peptide transport system permease subunit|nr:hypothetical protein [Prevotella sp.]MCH4183622.1 hypothetical protein [Prevotella sp.]MCH4212304.1 hypothetical protein [Prevotella sp.]MCH4240324.1 hypothetical protein [Prevotella sp.]MCI1741859.1 hypothetical protein [Prevotella sp.]